MTDGQGNGAGAGIDNAIGNFFFLTTKRKFTNFHLTSQP
jgi:hypothetical protein